MQCSAVAKHITNWLSDQIQSTHRKGFILGVSGGVDSALVSTLCATTGEPLTVMTLPIHQAEDQMKRADEHIDWLRNSFNTMTRYTESLYNPKGPQIIKETINLTIPFETFRMTLHKKVAEDPLAMANLRARLRMCTLYSYAGHYEYLVAGTGNLIEDFGVGFFTKWGDGAVDCSPIGNLSKSQVWELAKFLGIRDDIIQARPTDGLWADNRGDEDAIGASYPELEWAMAEAESKKINAGEWPATVRNWEMGGSTGPYTKREIEVMSIYLKRHVANMHKFNPIPVCPIPAVLL